MQSITLHRLTLCALLFVSLVSTAAADPVQIVGKLQNVNGVPLSGHITVVREVPDVIFTDHAVDETGTFRIESDSQGGLVLHAVAEKHASVEQRVPSGASGVITLNFSLPPAQDVQGGVIDALGNGVPNAAVRVRYYEPGKPVRRLSFSRDERRTDGDGRFLLLDVGIGVPFVVDVLALDYPPTSSKRITLSAGTTALDDIVLGDRGATVVVQVLDSADRAVSDVTVLLLADPAGRGNDTQGSWLHPRDFRRQGVTSQLGNIRFTGVPPGRIIARVKTADSNNSTAGEQRAVVSSGQELRITLRLF